jgi:hypothetical protein
MVMSGAGLSLWTFTLLGLGRRLICLMPSDGIVPFTGSMARVAFLFWIPELLVS